MRKEHWGVTLSRNEILSAKQNGSDAVEQLIKSTQSSTDLVFVLKNLGSLPASFGGDCFIDLLKHECKDVRLWAIKNLGKLKDVNLIPIYVEIIATDESSDVKREAASSIGRLRNEKAIPFLTEILKNTDPKVVCQAIRGLLVFKGNTIVDDNLKKLINNKNEMIVSVIRKEYFGNDKQERLSKPHAFVYPFLTNVVVNGDVRDVLRIVPDESIHLTFTSPPYYNARDYSIYPSYRAYLNFLADVFKEIYRITKDGRFLIVNTSPVIIPRISRAHSSKRYPIPFDMHGDLVAMGWEFIDDIIWVKPEYSVKNRIGGFQQHRKPLAYKPNSVTEYLMVYRKQTTKLIDWNIHQYNREIVEQSRVLGGFETTNVWQINPKSDKVHSAVFPYDLCKRVVEYYSFVGDLVFDPFGGSGTLGRTAASLNRKFFMTERDKRYFEYMKSFFQDSLFNQCTNQFLTLKQFEKTIDL